MNTKSGVMDFSVINKTVMDDTQRLCAEHDTLKKSIQDSIAGEYLVLQDGTFTPPAINANGDMKVIVSKERTFEAAEKYKGRKLCCLDFANYYHVGGAPWSARAQEESMCRISTLYPCLYAKNQEFYEKHTTEFVNGVIDDMGGDDLIFIPGVTVFKTDVAAPTLRPEADWFTTDVIVSAAPQLDLDDSGDGQRYRQAMTSRIQRILDVAAQEKEEVLVLGAFGCGAFCNPPEIVADIFAFLIRSYDFAVVEFAVYCRGNTTNYDVFNRRLT